MPGNFATAAPKNENRLFFLCFAVSLNLLVHTTRKTTVTALKRLYRGD